MNNLLAQSVCDEHTRMTMEVCDEHKPEEGIAKRKMGLKPPDGFGMRTAKRIQICVGSNARLSMATMSSYNARKPG